MYSFFYQSAKTTPAVNDLKNTILNKVVYFMDKLNKEAAKTTDLLEQYKSIHPVFYPSFDDFQNTQSKNFDKNAKITDLSEQYKSIRPVVYPYLPIIYPINLSVNEKSTLTELIFDIIKNVLTYYQNFDKEWVEFYKQKRDSQNQFGHNKKKNNSSPKQEELASNQTRLQTTHDSKYGNFYKTTLPDILLDEILRKKDKLCDSGNSYERCQTLLELSVSDLRNYTAW
ncbi:hypothetical protein [Holospora obtusa]|nr:hypothetical protein [Holospora obtusa]